jgi:hypothetical protein
MEPLGIIMRVTGAGLLSSRITVVLNHLLAHANFNGPLGRGLGMRRQGHGVSAINSQQVYMLHRVIAGCGTNELKNRRIENGKLGERSCEVWILSY